MGEVYLAEDLELGRKIALKVLPESMARNPERLQRFQREAKTLASLSHPNIVTIFSVESEDGLQFLTMELLEGQTLTQLIPRSGMSLSELFDIAIPLSDALAAAHDQGIIHRDLKPGNVMVTDRGIVKVLDFGLAKQSRSADLAFDPEAPTEPLTGEGRVLGTVPYMSPEQLRGKPVDHRTDIFSLGILLYQMATGDRPFKGETSAEVHSSILRDVPTAVDDLNAEVPHDVARVVSLCLEKNPDQRLQSAKDVRNELTVLREEISTGVSGSRPAFPEPSRRTAALGWYLLAIVLLVITMYGAWKLTRGGSDEDQWTMGPEAQMLFDQAELLELRATQEGYEQAEDRLRRALLLEPDHPVIQARLARLLSTLQDEVPTPDRTGEILELARSAIEADPDNVEAIVALGRHAVHSGDLDAAEQAANRAIETAPEDHAGYTLRGRVRLEQDRVDEGLTDLQQAVSLAGTDMEARLELAYSLWKLGRNNEAAGEYEKVLRYNPDSPAALNNLGAIYGQQGRLLDAIPLFKHLLELSDDADAAHNLANCYFFSDRMDEALAAYKRVLEIDPEYTYAPHGLAETYEKLGEKEKAREAFEDAVAAYDRYLTAAGADSQMLGLRAVCAAKLGRGGEAVANIEEALDLTPNSGDLLFNAAQVHAIAGNRNEALAYARRAIEAGYPRQEFDRDLAFTDYRDDPEFRTLLETAAVP